MNTHADSFDRDHGVSTEGVVWLTNPDSSNYAHGIRYEPCSESCCRWAIERIKDHPNYWFIDVGCGKGKPLLIAAEYSFEKLIGIEYSKRLCKVARRNLGSRAEIVCIDATEYQFPDHAMFLYCHNPFDSSVLCKVIASLSGHQFYLAWEGARPRLQFPVVAESHNVILFRSGSS